MRVKKSVLHFCCSKYKSFGWYGEMRHIIEYCVNIHRYRKKWKSRLKIIVAEPRTHFAFQTAADHERDVERSQVVLVNEVCCRTPFPRRNIGDSVPAPNSRSWEDHIPVCKSMLLNIRATRRRCLENGRQLHDTIV